MASQTSSWPWLRTHLSLLLIVSFFTSTACLRFHWLPTEQALLATGSCTRRQSLQLLSNRGRREVDRNRNEQDRAPPGGKVQKYLQGTSTQEIASASQDDRSSHSSYKLSPNNLRIIGGSAKGRPIRSPDVFLRPMMAKVRGALFNTLQSLGMFVSSSSLSSSTGLSNVRVLDLFSGAGSVGLEALSRGASHATFVDSSPGCVQTCLENAESLGFADQMTSVCAKAEDVLAGSAGGPLDPFHLVALTPPYTQVNYTVLVQHLCASASQSGLLNDNCVVVIEYPVEMGSLPFTLGPRTVLPSPLDGPPKRASKPPASPQPVVEEDAVLFGLRNRRYGRTVLGMYVHKPTEQFDLRPTEFMAESL